MSLDGMTLASVHGAVPPAAALCLGSRLAAVIGATPMAPERIVVDDGGGVTLLPGPVGPRWRAPEVRAAGQKQGTASTTAELWSLGRLLLELSLGRPVADNVADHADETRMKELADVDGKLLAPRLVEVLMVLLARSPGDRLQSPVAAARVFAAAEKQFGDGEAELMAVVARSRAPSKPAATMMMPSADVLPQAELARVAQEAAAERKRQQAMVKTEATKDLPARAILSEDELARIGFGVSPPQPQRQLPTQIVRQRELPPPASDLAMERTKPMKLLSAPTVERTEEMPLPEQPERAPLRIDEEVTRPLISADLVGEVSDPRFLPNMSETQPGNEPGEDAMARKIQQAQKGTRTLWAVAAVVVVVVVVVGAFIAMSRAP